MNLSQRPVRTWIEQFIWLLLLAIFSGFAYFYVFQMPYFHPIINEQFEITALRTSQADWAALQIGDRIQQIEDVTFESDDVYARARIHRTLADFKAQGTVSVIVERDGADLSFDMPITTIDVLGVGGEPVILSAVMYSSWLAAFIVITFVRPRDSRWWLLLAMNFINAAWVAFGMTGRYGYEVNQFLFETVVWLAFPVFVHLHWVFPKPLYRVPTRIAVVLYALIIGLIVILIAHNVQRYWVEPSAYLFDLNRSIPVWLRPILTYMYGLIAALAIVIWRFVFFPKQRRQLRLFNLTLAALFLFLALYLIDGYVFDTDTLDGLYRYFLLGQISLPFVYVFTIYRQQVDRFSMRANTIASLYSFVFVVGLLLVIALVLIQQVLPALPVTSLALIAAVVAILLSVLGFASWRAFFERRVLGIPVIPSKLLGEYVRRATTSQSHQELTHTLREIVLPSMLIRQSALLRSHEGGRHVVLYAEGVGHEDEDGVISAENPPWARLSIPLQLNDKTLGMWHLGQRDPDDIYDPSVRSILQGIADQTAIALSNIEQRNSLETLYQLNIEQEESERQLMAHELHDEVLNGLAALMMQVDSDHVSPQFHDMYDQLAGRLRWTIQQLRPPMLNYGIWIALGELAEALESRLAPNQSLLFSVPQTDVRLDPQVEQHVYRIVQQALENACRHSEAELIRLHGTIDANTLTLTIEDNGLGFAFGGQLNLPQLLARKQFGLVGMMERSSLIGAELGVVSAENQGTTISLHWQKD